MVRGDFKLIHNRGYGEKAEAYELYDLSRDPDELENLYSSHKDIGEGMSEAMNMLLVQNERPQE